MNQEVQKEIQNGLKVVEKVQTQIDNKIDRDFVERMFNKFRVVMSKLKEQLDQINCTFMGWVTREELEEVLEQYFATVREIHDTAGASSKFKCILCGRPRTHIAGMIVDENPSEDKMDPERQKPHKKK